MFPAYVASELIRLSAPVLTVWTLERFLSRMNANMASETSLPSTPKVTEHAYFLIYTQIMLGLGVGWWVRMWRVRLLF